MAEPPALEVSGLTAGYIPDLPILRSVSVRAAPGQVTLIIGPNGAGKSTLIKAIAGLVPVSAGEIRSRGTAIRGISPNLLADHGIAYVPQTDNIFRSLSISENLMLAARRVSQDPTPSLHRLTAQFPTLAQKQRDKAGTLSGGQRQFLAIAMALAADPKIILMDEPSAGLSPKAAEEVLAHARDLSREGVSVLLVEQNVKRALAIADHCYVLAEGRNQLDAPAADLATDKALGQIYLGGKRAPVS